MKLRIQAHLSRRDLGEMAGLSEKQVGLIERGKVKNPHIETAGNIADALSKTLGREIDVLDVFPLRRRFRR